MSENHENEFEKVEHIEPGGEIDQFTESNHFNDEINSENDTENDNENEQSQLQPGANNASQLESKTVINLNFFIFCFVFFWDATNCEIVAKC